jgi:prepilin-type processing-associated H-X9-DG protein
MTIIGILIGLLLPAVQSARESARMVRCKNNLKQLSLAALQHVEKQGHFPTGGWGWHWVGDPDRGFRKQQPGGWLYNCLPYLEQDALRNLGKAQTAAVKRQMANVLTRTPLAMLNCPSRRASIVYPKPCDGTYVGINADNNTASGNVAARGDYAMNSGSQAFNEYWPGPPSLDAGDSPSFGWHDVKACSGVSFERSEVQMAHVLDGASNTLLLGEKYLSPDYYFTGSCGADNESMYMGFDNDIYRVTNASHRPLADRPGYNSTMAFGGPHLPGCQFAFCDGSVRLLRYGIDGTTYANLGHRKDGAAIDESKIQ